VLAGWCVSIGGRWRRLGEIIERERFSREGRGRFASGSSFPSIPTANDKRKRVLGDLLNPEKILAGLFPPLGQFCKEE
jgi:hypothetical protein